MADNIDKDRRAFYEDMSKLQAQIQTLFSNIVLGQNRDADEDVQELFAIHKFMQKN